MTSPAPLKPPPLDTPNTSALDKRDWIAGLEKGPVSYTHLTLPTNREV